MASGGRGGIRTHGTLSRTPVFKTGALNHSATLPAQEFQSLSVGPARTQCERGPDGHPSRHFGKNPGDEPHTSAAWLNADLGTGLGQGDRPKRRTHWREAFAEQIQGIKARDGAEAYLAECRSQKAGAKQHEAGRCEGKKSVGDNVVVAHVTPTTPDARPNLLKLSEFLVGPTESFLGWSRAVPTPFAVQAQALER